MEDLSFNPTTPLTTTEQQPVLLPQRFRCHIPVCCHLVFSSSDEESPVRLSDFTSMTPQYIRQQPSLQRRRTSFTVQHHMNYHHMSTPRPDKFFKDATAKENFPTAPLDDDIWLGDPIPDRHVCIHKPAQSNYQCSYPCPYRLDLPQSSPEDTTVPYYELMDLNDTSLDIQDVKTTTSDEDIPNLEAILRL